MNIRQIYLPITKFFMHSGTFYYTNMSSSLWESPASFHRAIAVIPIAYKWKTCLFYLDNIFIFTNPIKKHIGCVDNFLRILKVACVRLMTKKSTFFTDSWKLITLTLHHWNVLFLQQTNNNFALFQNSAKYTDDLFLISHTNQILCILYSRKTFFGPLLLKSNMQRPIENK